MKDSYSDGDAVIVEDEAGVGASKLADRHGDRARDYNGSLLNRNRRRGAQIRSVAPQREFAATAKFALA